MSRAIADTRVRDYLEAVRARLSDLDPEAREHLLSDTEASLLEASEADLRVPLEVRLGPPERFARELRAAAGLPEELPRRERPGLMARIAAHPRVVAGRGIAAELAPVWWVVRGFAALTLLAQLVGDDWSDRYPIFTSVLGGPLGWILLVGAIWSSVALGRRERSAPRRWSRPLNLLLALVTFWMLANMITKAGASPMPAVVYVGTGTQKGVVFDGWTVNDIYPYDRRGRLLQDVRLYDQHGRPIDIRPSEGRPRRVIVDRAGAHVHNSYPIRYYKRGTRHVRHSDAGALGRQPRPIVTPPLHTGR
jgi:hypothetical protein